MPTRPRTNLDEVGELENEIATTRGGENTPRGTILKGSLGSGNSDVDVSGISLLDLADDLLRDRVHRWEGLAARRVDKSGEVGGEGQ